VRGALNRKLPLALQWCWSAALQDSIRKEHARLPFEAVVVSHSYAFVYAGHLGIPRVIVDAQNVEHRLFEQFSRLRRRERALIRRLAGKPGLGFLAASRTAASLRRLEHEVWGLADAILCVSRQEQAMVAEIAGPRSLYVPNCSAASGRRLPGPIPGRPRVSFAGSLDYIPNIDASVILADRVAPRLRSLVPQVEILVAGRRPSARLTRYCKVRGIQVIADPVSMSDVVQGSVAVCPVRLVGGTRLKILDARAEGRPVVATLAAVEGLEVAGDPGITVCQDIDELADAVAGALLSLPDTLPAVAGRESWERAWAPLAEALRLPASNSG